MRTETRVTFTETLSREITSWGGTTCTIDPANRLFTSLLYDRNENHEARPFTR